MQATASPGNRGREKLAANFIRTKARQRRRRHVGLYPDRHRHAAASDGAELFGHHQRVGVIEPLTAELDRLVEAEKTEIAELLEQLMRGKDVVLLPFIDEWIDFSGDEFLQDTARFIVVGGKEHCVSLSFRGGAKRRTSDAQLRIGEPRYCFTHL
jgi:hypothetical protein